jgi:Inhibitor of apoptosis-promoting Bax1
MMQASNQEIATHPGLSSADSTAVTRDQARAVFGQVMGFVALTLGFLALGAYIGRDLSGGWGILAFVANFGCVIGLNVASTRGNEQVAITLLFGLGLLLGLALGPVLSSYVEADPAAVWQAAGATGGFVAGLGAAGYAIRRDLSSWYRVLFWALLGLIVRARRALRLDSEREHHLVGGRARGLRRLHGPRLQPAAALGPGGGGADRGEHLPGCPEHLSVLPSAVRRKQQVTRRSL